MMSRSLDGKTVTVTMPINIEGVPAGAKAAIAGEPSDVQKMIQEAKKKPAPAEAPAAGKAPDLARRSVEHIEREYGKDNVTADEAIAALTQKMQEIEAKPENQQVTGPGRAYKYTPYARQRTDKVAWAIQRIMAAEKKKPKPEPDSGLKHLRHKGVLDVSIFGKAGRFILGGVEPARITIGRLHRGRQEH
jgi:hypothetical protein